MSRLAETLDVSVASATGIVGRMEERGLVERPTATRDRRVVTVRPTETGSAIFRDMTEQRRQMSPTCSPADRRRARPRCSPGSGRCTPPASAPAREDEERPRAVKVVDRMIGLLRTYLAPYRGRITS